MAEPQPPVSASRTGTAGAVTAVRSRGRLPDWAGPGLSRGRAVLAWTLGLAGLLAYNWWLLVPLMPGLMTSPSELFSNLEVSGQPYAAAMQHADVLSGVLVLGALLATGGRSIPAGRPDWLAMVCFAVAGTLGGLFPEVCADSINALCRRQEWRFELPVSQYVHIAAGILEFAGITIALMVAIRRTRGHRTLTARAYRRLGQAALACYPLLGLAYLVDRLGGLMEAVFFTGFTVMIVTQLAERTRRQARVTLPSRREAPYGRHPCGCGSS
jgi:hypothetical protein